MTYLQYHLLFILPALLVLALLTWRAARQGPVAGAYRPQSRFVWALFALFGLIPLLYTTPWDNYLVFRGVWSYPPERVLARIGYVPVEEYAFFLLQTLTVGLWLLLWLRRERGEPAPVPGWTRPLGAALWLLVSLAGVGFLRAESTLYLGLILAWACPVLAGLWAFGGDLIAAQRARFWWAVLPPTLYLWFTDLIAVRAGIWSISPTYTTGLNVAGLPVEEMLFFLITNLLVVSGLLLFWHPEALARIRRGTRGLRPWLGLLVLYALLKIPVPLWPPGFPLLATLSTLCLALAALSWAWARVGARALGLAALAFAVGLAVEVLGSRLGVPFGVYSYAGAPGPSLLGVPLLVPLGWFAMTLSAALLAGGRAWLAGLLLVAWDLGLEPLMTAQGFWTWGDHVGLWAGAPLQNFAAWFLVGSGLAWTFGRLAPQLFGGPARLPGARAALPGDFRLAYLIEAFFLPAGLLLLGQPLAGLVTLVAMGGGAWISWRLASAR